jgi:hypothetical protein
MKPFIIRMNKDVIESLADLLRDPYIVWEDTPLEKYWYPILEQDFNELTPIEQTKILINLEKDL